jgi:hypothetical protein
LDLIHLERELAVGVKVDDVEDEVEDGEGCGAGADSLTVA